VATGDSGREAYTAIAWGAGLSRERSDIAGAESFHSLEGNMCGTDTRGADALPVASPARVAVSAAFPIFRVLSRCRGYTLKFFRARQIQDATVPGGMGPEVPYRFLEACPCWTGRARRSGHGAVGTGWAASLPLQRREFITLLGGAAATWPLAVHAQQAAMPLVGWLGSETRKAEDFSVVGFREGLKEGGYSEGQNVTIEYRFADGHYDRLPALAADLVHRPVNVIGLTGQPAALAAKAATTTIPTVFQIADDPVQLGLVASLSRPGGNMSGVTSLNVELVPKQLELLHELVPTTTVMALALPRGRKSLARR
jgi:hypothetical protein